MDSVFQKVNAEVAAELKSLCDTEPRGMLNVSVRLAKSESEAWDIKPVEGDELDQYIGVATTKSAPGSYDALLVKESDWAVFTVMGPFPNWYKKHGLTLIVNGSPLLNTN